MYSVTKAAFVHVPPLSLAALEYWLAVVVILPFTARRIARTGRSLILQLVGMSTLWMGAVGCLFVGVKSTGAGLSAFIVGLTIVIVPLVSWVLGAARLEPRLVVSVVLVLGGMAAVFVLGSERSYGATTILLFVAAILFSVHIYVVARLTHRVPALVIVEVQAAITALGMLALSLRLEHWPSVETFLRPTVVSAILFGALGSTLLAFLLRTIGQRHTPPQYVGFYANLESLFALAIGIVSGTEALSAGKALGFAIVLVGMVLAQSTRGLALESREPRFKRSP